MTPEQSAKELIETFAETLPPVFYNQIMERNWYAAKKCALIAVDEIIQAVSEIEFDNEKDMVVINKIGYWNTVKNYIDEK